MIKSRVTTKVRTTIPQPIRSALGLKPGDEIVYEVLDGERVVIRRATAPPVEDPVATFQEWAGAADREAYADL